MKILVVDDHEYNQDLLSFILEDEGYLCITASSGVEAINICRNQADVDLILMDVSMPEMDGIEAAKIIKQEHAERLTPIIFVTVLDDADILAQCLDAGGDDFVPKPVNESVLLAKIKAHKRTRELYNNLREANKQLQYHKQIMDREHVIVERIFDRGASRIKTDCVNVKKYTSSVSMFNGDIVLESPSPSGGVYNLVGDFTGHGLAASIGTLPVTEIFYRLSEQQAGVSQLAREINRTLVDLLPENMFFCAAISYLDSSGQSLSVWLGGMNDIFVLSAENSVQRLISQHMPLGILPEEEFDETPLITELQAGDKVFIYTDGVNEATNGSGEEFGIGGIEAAIKSNANDKFQYLIDSVRDFQGEGLQNDDVSLVEITAAPLEHRSKESGERVNIQELYHWGESFPWRFYTRLRNEQLRSLDIVDQLMTFVGGIQGIELHREKIYTIISELYSNALEHGVLGLESSLKATPDGFQEYYEQRMKRMDKLEENGGEIEMELSFRQGDTNLVEFTLSDSGKGFDFEKICGNLEDNSASYGRGVPLLKMLCSSLEYFEGGSKVVATYDLRLN